MEGATFKQYLFGLVFIALGMMFESQSVTAQTCDVTWRKADNPRVISGTVTIPARQTVCAEPGVIVQSASSAQLDVYGNFLLQGTAAEPVVFSPVANPAALGAAIRIAGKLDAQFADISISVTVGSGGTLLVRDSRFRERGLIGSTQSLTAGFASKFISIQDTVFDSDAQFQSSNAGIYVSKTTTVLRNVTFRNGASANIGESNLFIDNFIGQNLRYPALTIFQFFYQPQFLDTLNVTGSLRECISFQSGSFEIGANNVLQGCQYPIKGSGGLMPGSVIPTTGNQNNWYEGSILPTAVYAPVAVPYVMNGGRLRGTEIYPGTTFKLKPNTAVDTADSVARVLGLPNAPITFEPWIAGQKWDYFALAHDGDKVEYAVFDGMKFGVSSDNFGGSNYYIDQSVFRNNDVAVDQPDLDLFYMEGNLFTNNAVAINATEDSGGFRLNGITNPNMFENNALAVRSTNGGNPEVPNNWWNSPTGPTTSQNPDGTGDIIQGSAQFQPFRTVRPDRNDHPPVVRLTRRPYQITAGNFDGAFEPGQKIILTWNAFDNATVVKQKIQVQTTYNKKEEFQTVVDNIPGSQRSYEFTIPNNPRSIIFIRIVATDDRGQEGWDEWAVQVQNLNETGALQFTTPLAGQTFIGGTEFRLNWQITSPFNSNIFTVYLLLDGSRKAVYEGSGNATGTLGSFPLPYVSTDSARFAVYSSTNKWFYTEPFAIRPDPRFPDAPPQISMTAPNAGQSFPVGGIVPIAWTASDNEAIRQFNILYSTDGGKTWITMVENLPPTATSYSWRTPFGAGFNNVRVRVVAVDRRYHNSSDGASRVFQLTSGPIGNQPPTVQITFPATNATFNLGESVFLAANAADGDGTIQRVEFYDGTTLIGTDATAPYQIGWNYPQTTGGNHTITARAVDNLNATMTSAPITVTINSSGGPAPLPIATSSLSSPANEALFDAPATITISATAAGGTQGISRVDFFLDTTLVGTATIAPYSITINNVTAGRHTIFARTTAGNGVQAISEGIDITVRPAVGLRTRFDFDGDGKADISVFRPTNGIWYMNNSQTGFSAAQWGLSSDALVPGDYDGDGKSDLAVFRRGADSTWYIMQSQTNTVRAVQWGATNLEQQLLLSDRPVPADYDGDGKTDFAVWRLTDHLSEPARFLILQSSSNTAKTGQWGGFQDTPVPADYDGDGKADFAVFRHSQGIWYVLKSSDNNLLAVNFGTGGDRLVPGDYDGDGKADFAVFRDGIWYLQRSRDGFLGYQFGFGSDKPVPADYDGDGKIDIAVYRDGIWYMQGSQTGFVSAAFGAADDKPIPNVFVP